MVVPVLNNVDFGYGRNQSIKLDTQFFGEENMRTHFRAISKLSWIDCTVNGTFVGRGVPRGDAQDARASPLPPLCIPPPGHVHPPPA
jgi:hypothetical protein